MKHVCLLRCLYSCLLLLPPPLVAQEKITVSGRVMDIDSEKPLAGVNVILKADVVGTITNAEGYFVLFTGEENLPLVLIVAEANYMTKKVLVQGSTEVLIVRLKQQALTKGAPGASREVKRPASMAKQEGVVLTQRVEESIAP